MSNFYIKFLKDGNVSEIHYRWTDKRYPNKAPAIKEGERDRRIVTILRKYLDMELKAGQTSVLNNRDFETLGELLSGLIFMDFNLRNDFEEWFNDVIQDRWQAESYNVFIEFERYREFDDLAILPWEYIFFSSREKDKKYEEPFLSASVKNKINFYRKVPFALAEAHDVEFFRLKPPLKILLVISNPFNHDVKKLDELLRFFSELKRNHPDDNQLEIRYLYNPSPDAVEFQKELNEGHPNGKLDLSTMKDYKDFLEGIGRHSETFAPDIIHYVGHGNVLNNTGKLSFAKANKDYGNDYFEEEIDDETFAVCIKESRLSPKLVLMQVCNGGRVVDYVNVRGTAICLLEKQIPYVIAMQNPVQEDHALQFTKTFYRNFIKGKNIGTCVSAGRYILGGQGEFNHKAFGSPVLFTLTDIPLSFDIQGEVQKPEPVVREEKEEEIIKYCNYPGCPYYGIEDRYSPDDVMCTKGHRLSTKIKVIVQESKSLRSQEQEFSRPKTVNENKTPENSVSFVNAGNPSEIRPGDNGSHRAQSNENRT